MSLVDIVLSRRSVRSYLKKDVPKDVLDKILEAGRQAPSAANRQPVHFIVLTEDEVKKELSDRLWNKFIKDSAFTVVGCAHTSDIMTGKWAVVDASIALENMVLAAWAMGVGSCWVGAFKEDKIKQLLNIPRDWKVVALVTFGYPAEVPGFKTKKPVEEIVSYGKF